MENENKSKRITKTVLVILRDFFSIFIAFIITDKVSALYNISEKYELFIYLGVLLILTAIVQIVKIIIKRYLKKK